MIGLGILAAYAAIIPAAFGIVLVMAALFGGNAHQRNVAAKLLAFFALVFVYAYNCSAFPPPSSTTHTIKECRP